MDNHLHVQQQIKSLQHAGSPRFDLVRIYSVYSSIRRLISYNLFWAKIDSKLDKLNPWHFYAIFFDSCLQLCNPAVMEILIFHSSLIPEIRLSGNEVRYFPGSISWFWSIFGSQIEMFCHLLLFKGERYIINTHQVH